MEFLMFMVNMVVAVLVGSFLFSLIGKHIDRSDEPR